ncbi:unnamed protein product [Penicillium salamii]|nr:unnamed protein product [Penicillium salamii]
MFSNDPENLQNTIYTTKGKASSRSYPSLERSFGSNAPNLLNPNHDLSNQHPQISRNLRARIQAVFEQRGGRDFSLCNCKYIPKASPKAPCAGHDQEFQDTWETKQDRLPVLRGHGRVTGGILTLCPDLQERIRIHGVLGNGTFGIAFLAQEWDKDAVEPVTDPEHYAIKAQGHQTRIHDLKESMSYPEMVQFMEPTGRQHYMPEEAVILIYLNNSERFPTVDSIYTHGMQWTLVMRACGDDFPEGKADILDQDAFLRRRRKSRTLKFVLPTFPPFSGVYLVNDDNHEIQVSEEQGCKIAEQFLQGMVHLADMGIYHGDISVNNYILDRDLNVQLIDLGNSNFSLTADGFQSKNQGHIPYQEYQMRPEMAVELMKHEQRWQDDEGSARRDANGIALEPDYVYLPTDKRQVSLWKYSAIVYGFMHGYWPWERREVCEKWHGNFSARYEDPKYTMVKNRRKRMINEDIATHETLSQDCQDVLQAALARNPEDRPDIQEMASFPWYSSWSAAEAESGRPLKRPRVDRYEEAQTWKGRPAPGQM